MVVGAGYIGLELGIAFRKLGCEVTVVEAHGPHPAALRRTTSSRPVAQLAEEARRHRASRRQGQGLDATTARV